MTANATKTQLFLCARESEVSARVTKRNSKKMETFAFNNFFLPLFLSLRVNFLAMLRLPSTVAARLFLHVLSAETTFACDRYDSFHSIQLRNFWRYLQIPLPIIIFPSLRNKKIMCARELCDMVENRNNILCMNERVLWDILTDNCYVLSLRCCFGVPVPDFHSFFLFHFHPAEIVCLKLFVSIVEKKWALRKWTNDSCVNFLFK